MSKKISYEEQQKNHSLDSFSLKLPKMWKIVWDYQGDVPDSMSGMCDHCELKHIVWYCEILSYGVCDKCMWAMETEYDRCGTEVIL